MQSYSTPSEKTKCTSWGLMNTNQRFPFLLLDSQSFHASTKEAIFASGHLWLCYLYQSFQFRGAPFLNNFTVLHRKPWLLHDTRTYCSPSSILASRTYFLSRQTAKQCSGKGRTGNDWNGKPINPPDISQSQTFRHHSSKATFNLYLLLHTQTPYARRILFIGPGRRTKLPSVQTVRWVAEHTSTLVFGAFSFYAPPKANRNYGCGQYFSELTEQGAARTL